MTEPEPTAEQKAAAILLMETEVRKLIRSEVMAALQDDSFLSSFSLYPLHGRILGMHSADAGFRAAVKNAITQILNNSSY